MANVVTLGASRCVSFSPTSDDLLAAYRLKMKRAVRSNRVGRTYILGAVILGALCGLAASLWGIAPVSIAVFAGGGYWLVFLTVVFGAAYLRLPRQVRRIFADQKTLHGKTVVEWSDAGISFSSARGESRFTWSDYIDAVADRDAMILLQSEVLMNFIPARVLLPGQANEIVRLVR